MHVCSLKVAIVFLRERCWSKRTIESALRVNESGRERLHERSLTKLAPGSNFEWHFWSQSHEFYLYTVSERISTKNKKEWQKNTLKQTKHQTKSQSFYKWTHESRDYSCWDRSFFIIPKNESALAVTNHLVKDRSRKPGSIQERSLAKLAPVVHVIIQWHFTG